MSNLSRLFAFAAEHQARECELRRLQNCVAAESPCSYVGIVDTSYCDEPFANHTLSPQIGVIPLSDKAPSNWHVGNPVPFVLNEADKSTIQPDGGMIRNVWITLYVTSTEGFLCTLPDGEGIFIRWGQEGVTRDGLFRFRVFNTPEEAQQWTRQHLR